MAVNVEVTSYDGASKWIRDVVSHTDDEIISAWEARAKVVLVDTDACKTAVDLDEAFLIRFQDGRVFQRKSQEVANGRGGGRRSS